MSQLQDLYSDPVLFLHTVLPHMFPGPIPWVHRGILAFFTRQTDFLLQYGELEKIEENFVGERGERLFEVEWSEPPEGGPAIATAVHLRVTRNTLLMLPRGFSKTTLVGIGVVLWYVLFQERQFLVYISETATHSSQQLRNVRAELEGNPVVKSLFGGLRPDQRQGLKWTDDIIELTNGCVVVARGRGAQIRGLNNRGRRPDAILFDDLEDKESVATEEQRHKTRTWFYSDVMPALASPAAEAATGANPAMLAGLGTLLHQEALLQVLRVDPEWTPIVFGARDRSGQPLWPEMLDEASLERKRQSYATAGLLSEYYLEFHNEIRAAETQKFKRILHEPVPPGTQLMRAIVLDPAISDAVGADYAAIVVVGMAKESGLIYVLDTWAKVGATPREQIDAYFELAQSWRCARHGVESIAFQAALIHLLREEMFRKKYYFEPIPIKHTSKQKKTERVEGILQPRYAAGYVRHTQSFPELEAQLLDWPRGKKDLPDALAMAVSLLDPYAALAAPEDLDLSADVYPPLDEVVGEWRSAL